MFFSLKKEDGNNPGKIDELPEHRDHSMCAQVTACFVGHAELRGAAGEGSAPPDRAPWA